MPTPEFAPRNDAAAVPRSLLPRVLFALALAFGLSTAITGPAAAHTEIDFTLPTDGASVGEPIEEVTVAFFEPVELIGNGFEALDPQGNLVVPFPVSTDNTLFRLQFDPPLAGGAVGVRYEVRAEDGHVISGSFSFTVDAPPPTMPPSTTTPPSTTAAPAPTDPPATEPAATAPATAAPNEPSATTPSTAAPEAVAADAAAAPTTEPPAPSSTDADDDEGGDGGSTGLIIAVVAVVGVAAAGFLLLRSRTGST